jgi:hypothetical protein
MTQIIALLFSLNSQAAAYDFLVMEPAQVTCQVLPGRDHGTMRCDILHAGLQVHEGRETSIPFANGDCVKCNTTLNDALGLGRRVRMYRGYVGSDLADWHMQGFFVVDQPESCSGERRR